MSGAPGHRTSRLTPSHPALPKRRSGIGLIRGRRGVMFRVRLVAVSIVLAMGAALAGCSSGGFSMPSMPDWMPEWAGGKPPPPPMQALQFESAPPGADVRTAQGQTCRTPCSLAVPVTNQSVTFALNGYQPQTVPIQVNQAADLVPNPVEAALQPIAPPRKAAPKVHKKLPPKTAAQQPPPPPGGMAPPPPENATLGDRFSPATQSAFPPPQSR